ncbi:hypothetical protein JW835_13570 [bacterium]|nr:hypothetical protein [bacterium]
MKTNRQIFIALLFTVAQLSASGFATLKMGSDAKTGGMGMAATALAGDGSATFYNPASAGMVRGHDLVLSLHQWMDDLQSEFAGLVIGSGNQGVGLYVLFTEIGQLEHRLVPSETPLGTFSAHEMCIALSYGRRIASNLRIGLSFKGYYEKIFIDDTWGLGGDIGILYDIPFYSLRIGGVLQNMGDTGRFNHQSIPLPLTGRLGFFLPVSLYGGSWIITLDGVKEEGFPVHVHTGTEYCWRKTIALRLGMQTGYETRSISGGFGIIYHRFRLDYSLMPLSMLGDSHRLSLGISW